jgi:hypothetical protein
MPIIRETRQEITTKPNGDEITVDTATEKFVQLPIHEEKEWQKGNLL